MIAFIHKKFEFLLHFFCFFSSFCVFAYLRISVFRLAKPILFAFGGEAIGVHHCIREITFLVMDITFYCSNWDTGPNVIN